MSAPVDEVLAKLAGVKKQGGSYVARCPAHDDRHASLSVSIGEDDRVLLRCHANCNTKKIVAELGLEMRDLFPPQPARARATAEYEYLDEHGKFVHGVVRRTGKKFSQFTIGPDGKRVWRLNGVRQVPFRLPELLEGVAAGEWILIPEGEKDCCTLVKHGFVATTNAMGAGKWREEYGEHFAGAKVAILPDNDQAGLDHAAKVAASLARVAEVVKIVELPGVDESGDVSDWLGTLGGVDDLESLIRDAPAWESVSAAAPPTSEVEEGWVVLADLERFIRRFCVFPSADYAVAVALWIAHTHCIDALEITPRIAFISETKQTGKSRTLEVIDLTAARTRYVGSMTIAYLFRLVDAHNPTLLFDEVDAVFGPKARDNEELRSLINVGFRRSATVGRCVGEGSRQVPTEFAAFCPVALAGIGDCLPDTVLDRSIVLRMRRRAPNEVVDALRYRRIRPEAEVLRARLELWGNAHVEALESADPEMPEGITDRPADTREAILAVADAAGGDWPDRARGACERLNDARGAEDPNISVRLLGDIRAVMGDDQHIFSRVLCQRLNALEEAPWSGWNQDKDHKGIQPRDLARRLKGFGIESKQVRIGSETAKGYESALLADTFTRYLPPIVRNKGNKGNAPGRGVSHVSDVSFGEDDVDVVLSEHVRDDLEPF